MPTQQHPTGIILPGTEAQVRLATHTARELVAGPLCLKRARHLSSLRECKRGYVYIVMPSYVRHTEDKDVNWFLDTVLVRDIATAIEAGAGYLAFGLIAEGVEVIGALLDEQEFEKTGESEARFGKAMSEVFTKIDPRYGQYNKADSKFYLYESLRCGMAHILRPKSPIIFTGRSDAGKLGAHHLDLIQFEGEDPNLLLVIEVLHDHLTEAVRRTKNLIKKKTHAKLKKGYISLSHVAMPSRQNAPSASFPSLSGSYLPGSTGNTSHL